MKNFSLNTKNLIRILKGSHIADIDEKCIKSGADSKMLMKKAGNKLSEFITEILFKEGPESSSLKKITVICGSGNNGGDGHVCASELVLKGYRVSVYCLNEKEKFTEDTLYYFNNLENLMSSHKENLSISFIHDLESRQYRSFKEDTESSDLIVDALFGTGLHGTKLRGLAKNIIGQINDARAGSRKIIVLSTDIPSGIDSDDGRIIEEAVKADYTVTFGAKKTGTANYPGAFYAGSTIVSDIGIDPDLYGSYEQVFEPTFQWVSEQIPLKGFDSYKHKVGKLLVIAGSIGFTGAADLVCSSAMRSGAGIVTLVCPWELNPIFESKLTETMTFPVDQTEEVTLHLDSLNDIIAESEKYDALVIGPGISKNPNTVMLVRELLKKIKKPTVLDADGLKALSGPMISKEEELYNLNHVIITPHPGELAGILARNKIPANERLELNEAAAKKFNAVSVLKGAGTIITDRNALSFINPTGDWALSTAGSGDVLSGIIGSLLCQGMDNFTSAACGAYIHGLASDIASRKTSKTSMIASDLLEGLKEVFLRIEKLKY